MVTLDLDIDAKVDTVEARLTNKIEKFDIKVDGQITHLKWMSGVTTGTKIGPTDSISTSWRGADEQIGSRRALSEVLLSALHISGSRQRSINTPSSSVISISHSSPTVGIRSRVRHWGVRIALRHEIASPLDGRGVIFTRRQFAVLEVASVPEILVDGD